MEVITKPSLDLEYVIERFLGAKLAIIDQNVHALFRGGVFCFLDLLKNQPI